MTSGGRLVQTGRRQVALFVRQVADCSRSSIKCMSSIKQYQINGRDTLIGKVIITGHTGQCVFLQLPNVLVVSR